MSPTFFNKIKLFKGAEIQPRKIPVESAEAPKELGPFERLIKSPWTFLVLITVVISIFLSYVPSRSLSTIALG
jgi:hypothetical protein